MWQFIAFSMAFKENDAAILKFPWAEQKIIVDEKR